MKICISAETREEQRELTAILTDLGIACIIYSRIVSRLPRVLNKLLDIIFFIIYLRKNRVAVVVGAPCIRNRAARFLLKIKFASYIRSLHPASEKATSLSDLAFFFTKKNGLHANIFNPYSADACFVSSPITMEFLIKRGIPKELVQQIGAVWLRNQIKERGPQGKGRVILITQAFSEHKHVSAQKEQLEIIKRFGQLSNKDKKDLVIRVHPRDRFDYLSYINDNKILAEINKKDTDEFISSICKEDYIVSPFSTLGFEISHMGGNVQFISMCQMTEYQEQFKRIGVEFVSWEEIQPESLKKTIVHSEIFFPYSSAPLELFLRKNAGLGGQGDAYK